MGKVYEANSENIEERGYSRLQYRAWIRYYGIIWVPMDFACGK